MIPSSCSLKLFLFLQGGVQVNLDVLIDALKFAGVGNPYSNNHLKSLENLIFIGCVSTIFFCDISPTRVLGMMMKFTMRYILYNNILAQKMMQE